MSTGRFNTKLNAYFGATDGAYTTMTQAEVDKLTFNVKTDIKNLLLQHHGEEVIEKWDSKNNIARFSVSDKVTLIREREIDLVCRYSKPAPKREMSIYFTGKSGVPREALKDGNVWFIYYKPHDPFDFYPWIGIMTPEEWKVACGEKLSMPVIVDFVEDEREAEDGEVPDYSFNIEETTFLQTPPPVGIDDLPQSIKEKLKIPHNKVVKQEKAKSVKGKKGEEIVLHIEKQRMIANHRPDLVNKINWVAKTTDGYGYDIESFDFNASGEEYKTYIEVKATVGNDKTPFNVSLNEVRVSKEKGEAYRIYRVYNLNETGDNIGYYIVKGSVEDNFHLQPVDYKAYKKMIK